MPSAISLWASLGTTAREQNRREKSTVTSQNAHTAAAFESPEKGLAIFRNYNRTLLSDATALLSNEWGVREEDFPASKEMRDGSPMVLVSTAFSIHSE